MAEWYSSHTRDLSSKVLSDLNSDVPIVTPRVVIYDVLLKNGSVKDVHLSTSSIVFGGINYKPLLLGFPTVKYGVNLNDRKFKISYGQIELSNHKEADFKFSEYLNVDNLIHKNISIYINTQSSLSNEDSMLFFSGRINKIEHNFEQVNITIEDESSLKLRKMMPEQTLPTSDNISDKYKGEPIPILYGFVDKAPVVCENSTLKASDVAADLVVSGGTPYTTGNGYNPSSGINYYNNYIRHRIFTNPAFDSLSPVLISTGEGTAYVPTLYKKHMDNTIEELQLFLPEYNLFHSSQNPTGILLTDPFHEPNQWEQDLNVDGWIKLKGGAGLLMKDALQIEGFYKPESISLTYRSDGTSHNGDHLDTGFNNPERWQNDSTITLTDNSYEYVNLVEAGHLASDHHHVANFEYMPDISGGSWPQENPVSDIVNQTLCRLRFVSKPPWGYVTAADDLLKVAINEKVMPNIQNDTQIFAWITDQISPNYDWDISSSRYWSMPPLHVRLDLDWNTGEPLYYNYLGNQNDYSFGSDYSEWYWHGEASPLSDIFYLSGSEHMNMISGMDDSNRVGKRIAFTCSWGFTSDAWLGGIENQMQEILDDPYLPNSGVTGNDAAGNYFQFGRNYMQINNKFSQGNYDIFFGKSIGTAANLSGSKISFDYTIGGHWAEVDFKNLFDIQDSSPKDKDYFLAIHRTAGGVHYQTNVIKDIGHTRGGIPLHDTSNEDSAILSRAGEMGFTWDRMKEQSQALGYDFPEFHFSITEQSNIMDLISDISKSSAFGLTPCVKKGFLSMPAVFYSYGSKYIPASEWDYSDPEYYEQVVEVKNYDIIEYSFGMSPSENVYTKVKVKYHFDYSRDKFLKDTESTSLNTMGPLNLAYYGYEDSDDNILEIEGHHTRDELSAKQLSEFYYQYYKNQHLRVKLKLPLKYIILEVGMMIRFKELIDGMKASGIDYTYISNPTLKRFMIDDVDNDARASQYIYPWFYIYSMKVDGTQGFVEIEAEQLHYLHDWRDISLDNSNFLLEPITCNEWGIFKDDLGLIEPDTLLALDAHTGGTLNSGDLSGGGVIEDDPWEGAVPGCTIHWADNYNPDATIDNGSCTFHDDEMWNYDSYYDTIYAGHVCTTSLRAGGESGGDMWPSYGATVWEYPYMQGWGLPMSLDEPILVIHAEGAGNDNWLWGQGLPYTDETSGFNVMWGLDTWGIFNEFFVDEEEWPDIGPHNTEFTPLSNWNDLIPLTFEDITNDTSYDYKALQVEIKFGGESMFTNASFHVIHTFTLRNTANIGEAVNLEWVHDVWSGNSNIDGSEWVYMNTDEFSFMIPLEHGSDLSAEFNHPIPHEFHIYNYSDYLLLWQSPHYKHTQGQLSMSVMGIDWASSYGSTELPAFNGGPPPVPEDSGSSTFMLGDLNFDGTHSVLDIVLMVDFIMNDEYSVGADISNDGEVDVLDMVLLIDAILYGSPDDGSWDYELVDPDDDDDDDDPTPPNPVYPINPKQDPSLEEDYEQGSR